jgi:anti-anti-sigma factor
MFIYHVNDHGMRVVVSFEGDLDIEATEIMEEEVIPALQSYSSVEIDFANVPFVDSSGIGLFIKLVQAVRDRNGDVLIRGLTPAVMEVFSLLQLPQIIGHQAFEQSTI